MSKYSHIEDAWVREALEEYKDKIDENKSHRLDISSYRVEKPWGYELWLELNEHYAYKCQKHSFFLIAIWHNFQ